MAANQPSAVRLSADKALDVIVDEVTALAPELVSAAARAWSANTVRAFLSDLRLWDRWCRRSHVQTGAATPRTVAAYVRALSGQDVDSEEARATEARSAATIGRYLVYIGWAYRMAGRDDPTAAPLVRLELKAARKAVGTRQT
jgi:site-specific recombinase XerD